MCDQTRIEEICEERQPAIGDAWTKKCSVPPNIRNEVLKEVLLHTSSPKVSFCQATGTGTWDLGPGNRE